MLKIKSKGIWLLIGFLSIILYCDRERGSKRELPDLSQSQLPPAPEWVRHGVIYEIFPRVFSEEGNFAGIEKKLDYIQQLGANIIWLMPIFPVGEKDRKGSLGSPYAVRDLRAINPDYGTAQDLRNLISQIHRRGMKIILDIVPNHGSTDYVLMKSYPQGFLSEADSGLRRKEADWTDVTDFNYNDTRIREYLKEVFHYWIDEFDIDGYRCDVAGLVPYDFWKELLPELKAQKPDIFLLSEWEDPEILLTGFQADYGWTEYHEMVYVRLKKKRTASIFDVVQEKSALYPKNHHILRFLENHDEDRSIKVFGIEAIEAFTTVLFTLPGIPLIYAGQEFGEAETPSLFEPSTLNWENTDDKLIEMYQQMIRLRRSESSFTAGKFLQLQVASLKGSVAAYARWTDSSAAFVITNLWSDTAEKILISVPRKFLATFESYQWKSFPDIDFQVDINNLYFEKILPYQTLVFLGKE